MPDITVAVNDHVDVGDYLSVMDGSGLAARRPYGDDNRLGALLARSAPIVTAHSDEGALVGVARSITDGGFITFLCDLAIVEAYQGQGIARQLVEATRDACPDTLLIVTAAPEVDAFYDHLGLRRHHSTWYGLPDDLSAFPDPPPHS